MVKKKIISVMITLLIIFGLTACGNEVTNANNRNENLNEVIENNVEESMEESTEEVIEESEEEVTATENNADSEEGSLEEVELTGEFKEFNAIDIYGNEVTEDIIKGKKLIMINIWATFCTPCLSEMPDLGELAEEYADEDVLIIGICADIRDESSLETAIQIVEDTGANYTHLQVEQFDDLYEIYLKGVQAVPETIFLDSTGTIIGSEIGSKSKASWESIIDGYLN